ncbi:hypothetical protein DYB32_001817 [Aphanomyces invadans]|uniref:Uncharacterized protein n=1 Tax=Aphanomyces invadans TaxID=157072 RepID=A0A418B4W1_9STRA|nr:hypothetical protein DYB32_001817 [Aphanomyces invadans]
MHTASQSSRTAKTLVAHARALARQDSDERERFQSTDAGLGNASPVGPAAEQHGILDLVVDEMCSTEATYVKNLVTLVESFVKPLQEAKHPMMTNSAVAVFFNTLQELVKLNSTFLEELMQVTLQREHGQNSTERIVVLFNQYIPLFTSFYSEYAKYFDDFTPLLNEYKTQSKGFSTLLDVPTAQCQRKGGSNQTFESLLILPIQRIPRYNLLLQRVVKHTREDHPDLASLKLTVQAMGEAAQRMDETLRQKEKTEEVLRIQAQFAGQVSLFALNRHCVRSGMLVKVWLPSIPCMTILEGDNTMSSAQKSFVLFAPTVQDKQAWVSTIGRLITETQAKDSTTAVDSAPAAVWIPDSVSEECSQCRKAFRLLLRRHHCRRCGFVVCGLCSEHRSILFDNDMRPVRVCNKCNRVLDLVKQSALTWLGCLIEFKKRTLLRRDRKNKWSEYEFDIKGGVLRQYHGGAVIQTLNLAGAIVSDRFVSMLAEIQLPMNATTLHQLRTFLNMPIERIPKYSLYLAELKPWTSEAHMDYKPLMSAIAAIHRVVQIIRDTVEARESTRKLRQVEFKYGLPPDKDRQFVKEGLLRKVCRNSVKVYHIVLFTNGKSSAISNGMMDNLS